MSYEHRKGLPTEEEVTAAYQDAHDYLEKHVGKDTCATDHIPERRFDMFKAVLVTWMDGVLPDFIVSVAFDDICSLMVFGYHVGRQDEKQEQLLRGGESEDSP